MVIGLAAMIGDLTGIVALKGLATATGVSPTPRVFSAVRGYETWTTAFSLEWRDGAGTERRLDLTPEVYQGVRGPYNRRNTYGAIVAYGPVLAASTALSPLFDSVSRYAVCNRADPNGAPLLREAGLDPTDVVGPVTLQYHPRTDGAGQGMGPFPERLVISCR